MPIRRNRVTAELSNLRRQVQAAHGTMYAAAAQAGARGLLSPEDIQDVRRISKPGSPRKVTSVTGARSLVELYQSKAVDYTSRLAAAPAPAERVLSLGAGHGDPTCDALIVADSTGDLLARSAVLTEGEGVGSAPQSRSLRGARGRIAEENAEGPEFGLLTQRAPIMQEVAVLQALTDRHARRAAHEPGAPRWVIGLARDPRLPDGATVHAPEEARQRMREKMKAYAVAMTVAGGTSARAALEASNLVPTPSRRRQALRLGRKFQATRSIEDARPLRAGAKRTVLTDEMRQAILALAMRYPNANATGLQLALEKHVSDVATSLAAGTAARDALLRSSVEDGTVRVPSTDSIRRALSDLGPALALWRARGARDTARQTRPVMDHAWAAHGNARWEIDHTGLNVTAKLLEDGEWVTADLWATAVVDAYSRAILALVVSERNPDSMTVAIALRAAIQKRDGIDGVEPSGIPDVLVSDNGADFRSAQTEAFCAMAGISQQFCDPYSPNERPHVERFFRTLKETLVPLLLGAQGGREHGEAWSAGRISRLLTVPQIRGEITRWVNEEYNRTPHSQTGEKPIERWRASAPATPVIADRSLDLLLLYTARRRVTRGVVAITERGRDTLEFCAPCLTGRDGEDLTLRYNPDDALSVLAYDVTNTRFIGELWNVADARSPYSREHGIEAWHTWRSQHRVLQAGFEERIAAYHDEINATDRQRKHDRDALEIASDGASVAALDAATAVDTYLAAAEQVITDAVDAEQRAVTQALRQTPPAASAAATRTSTNAAATTHAPSSGPPESQGVTARATSAPSSALDPLAAELAAFKRALSS